MGSFRLWFGFVVLKFVRVFKPLREVARLWGDEVGTFIDIYIWLPSFDFLGEFRIKTVNVDVKLYILWDIFVVDHVKFNGLLSLSI